MRNKTILGNKNLLNLFKVAPHDTMSSVQDKPKKFQKAQLSNFYSFGWNDVWRAGFPLVVDLDGSPTKQIFCLSHHTLLLTVLSRSIYCPKNPAFFIFMQVLVTLSKMFLTSQPRLENPDVNSNELDSSIFFYSKM